MKDLVIYLIFCLALYAGYIHHNLPQPEIPVADNPRPVPARPDIRVQKLERFFTRYNSKLLAHVSDFILVADRYQLDYRLLPGIAGVESTFCLNYIPSTNNCFGIGQGNIRYDSLSESIDAAGRLLARSYDLSSIESIAKRYCPPTWQSWSQNVRYFMQELEKT